MGDGCVQKPTDSHLSPPQGDSYRADRRVGKPSFLLLRDKQRQLFELRGRRRFRKLAFL